MRVKGLNNHAEKVAKMLLGLELVPIKEQKAMVRRVVMYVNGIQEKIEYAGTKNHEKTSGHN